MNLLEMLASLFDVIMKNLVRQNQINITLMKIDTILLRSNKSIDITPELEKEIQEQLSLLTKNVEDIEAAKKMLEDMETNK